MIHKTPGEDGSAPFSRVEIAGARGRHGYQVGGPEHAVTLLVGRYFTRWLACKTHSILDVLA